MSFTEMQAKLSVSNNRINASLNKCFVRRALLLFDSFNMEKKPPKHDRLCIFVEKFNKDASVVVFMDKAIEIVDFFDSQMI